MKNSDELGKEKIGKLLRKQSVPAIIGFVVMSLYNLVDTIFIGWGVGSIGIAAVAIVFPIHMIVMAISQTLGIGSSSMISRALGAKDKEKASRSLGNFFTLTILLGIIVTILGIVFIDPLLILFGATEAILPFARSYLFITLLGSLPIIFAAGANAVIRSEGRAKYAMAVMIVSSVLNIILDPILIFGFNMGIEGAALATLVSYIISGFIALYYFTSGIGDVKVKLKDFILKLNIVKEKFAIGASSFARMAAGSVMAIIVNNSLGFYGGEMAIAAFGIINRLLMFLIMPMFGIVQGMQPILGYNFGAKKLERVREVIKLSVKVSTIMSIVAFIVLMLFAKLFMMMFTPDVHLINLSARATRIIVIMLPLVGFQIIVAGMYQAMGKAWKALFFSMLRQVVFLIPLVLILPLLYGLDGIWFTFPIADLLAAIVTGIVFVREMKRLV